jgi:hypothetical protein
MNFFIIYNYMSEDSSSHIGDALQQQSFLHRVREYLLSLEDQYSALDEESMMFEIDISFTRKQICSLEAELKKYRGHAEKLKLSDAAFQEKRRQMELRRSFLKDLQSMLSGEVNFSHDSALFFNQSLLDFASARGWGEMTLMEKLGNTDDGMMFDIDGKVYAFLQLSSDQYIFHPDELSPAFRSDLESLSD